MGASNFVQTSFLGGEWSERAQGRYHDPNYKRALSVCRNSFPLEEDAWTRRPGFWYAGHTKAGNPGRLFRFDFQNSSPYLLEFTDGFLRLRQGTSFVFDSTATVTSISGNTLTLSAAVTWSTGDECVIVGADPITYARQFLLTKIDTTHFTITDPVTGAAPSIAWTGAATVKRIQYLTSPFTSSLLPNMRLVRQNKNAVFLNGASAPQYLQTVSDPTSLSAGVFTLTAASFIDGPYLDPVVGATVTPSATSGQISLTMGASNYVSTQVYSAGDFVASSSIFYKSLVDANVGNTPASSPTKWAVISADQMISPAGLAATDIGRSIRLLTNAGDIWTWGKITSTLYPIGSGVPSSVSFGNMTNNANAFDGDSGTFANLVSTGLPYAGLNYSGSSAQRVSSITITASGGQTGSFGSTEVTANLRASSSLPGAASAGTLLGSAALTKNGVITTVTIPSNDTTSTWNYVWVELANVVVANPPTGVITKLYEFSASLVVSATTAGFNVNILGPALGTTGAISVWRIGAYSDTTGYPTCGCWHDGRLWLGGVASNRIDGSVPNQPFNFAPTLTDGTVTDASAISYTFNSSDLSPAYWMESSGPGIIVGTQKGEWLVQATTANEPLTPTNIQARRHTQAGSANIAPVLTEHTFLFAQTEARKVQELFTDAYSGKLTTPNLSKNARHLTSPGIAQLAYQRELAPIVWMRTTDGKVRGCTYKRTQLITTAEPDFAGWHRHDFGLTAEDICVSASLDGGYEQLCMVAYDGTKRSVLIMDMIAEEGDALGAELLLDQGVLATAVEATVSGQGGMRLYGLWHLNGQTVQATASGLDLGDYLVANGSAFIPYGNGTTNLFTRDYALTATITVGLTYTSQGQLLRPILPNDTGAQNNGFAKFRRVQKYGLQLQRAMGLVIGTVFDKLRVVPLKSKGGRPYTGLQPFSGIVQETLADDEGFDGQVAWEVTRPVPATVTAAGGFIHTQDQ